MATVHSADFADEYSSHPEQRGDGRSSVGGLLRRARERRGLTLQEIAKETKIPQRHLEALETDNLAILGSGFYQRAEIRAYARAVGLDEHTLLSRLDYALRPAGARAALRETRGRRRFPRAYVLVAISVLAVVAFGLAIFQRAPTQVGGAVAPVATGSARTPAPRVSDETARPLSTTSTSTAPAAIPATGDAGNGAAILPSSANSVTELVVTTEPAGARVTVNGIAWGLSPVTIHHLPPGDKRIRVTREGYAAQERDVRLDEGRQRALDIQLESAP